MAAGAVKFLYVGLNQAFEQLSDDAARNAESIAREIGADPALLYRLLRALSSINLRREDTIADFRSLRGGGYAFSPIPTSHRERNSHEHPNVSAGRMTWS